MSVFVILLVLCSCNSARMSLKLIKGNLLTYLLKTERTITTEIVSADARGSSDVQIPTCPRARYFDSILQKLTGQMH